MKEFTEKLYASLEEELEVYAGIGDIQIKKLTGALKSVGQALALLKNYIAEHPFKDEAEEVVFFKYEKPKFLCERIFLLEMAALESNRPQYDDPAVKTFYEQELALIRRFFDRYKFLYRYYKADATDMDHLFFLRSASLSEILLPEPAAQADPQFSTNCDYIFSKFIALERLQAFLIGELKSLTSPARLTAGPAGETPGVLKWTGESINLVELAYGIWLTGQANHGNASITEIVEWLEAHFHVKIGAAHRRWQSITRRKRLAPFKYVDELKAALEKRLNEEWER